MSENPAERRDPHGELIDGYLGDVRSLIEGAPQRPPLRVDGIDVSEVAGGRNTAFYNGHSYHTKVPPEAIRPFLEHFTRPGDVVLDPFCGSGMTGVAAALAGRRTILNDLSVAAAHLSFNHTHVCDADALEETFAAIYRRIRPEFERLYHTRHTSRADGYVHYTIWSPKYACPACRATFLMWDVVDRTSGRVGTKLACPACRRQTPRRQLRVVANVPAMLNYQVRGGNARARVERSPTKADLAFITSFGREQIHAWYPKVALDPNREMYIRCALRLHGIEAVADFYTPRNLLALARLWEEIGAVRDVRVRQALTFAFTNTAWHGTKMRRFNARGGQRPLTGTLYVPQLSVEVNVLEVMNHKVQQLGTYYRALRPAEGPPPVVRLGSATSLSEIPDGSVDYVFTDPPFGSNLFYADCNVIWEAWLSRLTQPAEEAVVNRSLRPELGGKTVADYERLMCASLREMHRVLKPGGWVTLVFHNTDAAVWSALQRAAGAAGFDIERAANLDRQQQSHKGYKGRAGEEQVAHFDVIVSMRKLGGTTRAANRRAVTREEMRGIVEALRAEWPLARFTVQRVHAEVLRRLAASDGDLGSVEFSTIEALCRASPPPTRGHPAATASARKRKAGIASNAQGSLFRREEWKP